MIRSTLRLQPLPDGASQVIDFYEQRQILARALSEGGCLAAELHLRLPDRDEVVVSALWASAEDYAAWAGSRSRATEVGDLEELLVPESLPLGAGDVHEVVTLLPECDA